MWLNPQGQVRVWHWKHRRFITFVHLNLWTPSMAGSKSKEHGCLIVTCVRVKRIAYLTQFTQRISKINMKSNERESTDFAVKIRISRNFPVSGWPRPGCLRPDARFVPCPASSVYYDHCGQKHLFTIPKPTLAHLRTRMRARTHRAGETAIIIRTRLEIEAAEENDDQKADKGEHICACTQQHTCTCTCTPTQA